MPAPHKTSSNANNQHNTNYFRYLLLALGFFVTLRMLFSDQESQSQQENKTLQLSFLFGLFQLSYQLMGSASDSRAFSLANVLALLSSQAQPTSGKQLSKRQVQLKDESKGTLNKYQFQKTFEELAGKSFANNEYVHGFQIFDLTVPNHFLMIWKNDSRAYHLGYSASGLFMVNGVVLNSAGAVINNPEILIPATLAYTQFVDWTLPENDVTENLEYLVLDDDDDFFYEVSAPVNYIKEFANKFYISWIDYLDNMHVMGFSVQENLSLTIDFQDIVINNSTKIDSQKSGTYIITGTNPQRPSINTPSIFGIGSKKLYYYERNDRGEEAEASTDITVPSRLITLWIAQTNNSQVRPMYVRLFYANGTLIDDSERPIWNVTADVPQQKFVISEASERSFNYGSPENKDSYFDSFQIPYLKCGSVNQTSSTSQCSFMTKNFQENLKGRIMLSPKNMTDRDACDNFTRLVHGEVRSGYFPLDPIVTVMRAEEYLVQLVRTISSTNSTSSQIYIAHVRENNCEWISISNGYFDYPFKIQRINEGIIPIKYESDLYVSDYFITIANDNEVGLLKIIDSDPSYFTPHYLVLSDLFHNEFERNLVSPIRSLCVASVLGIERPQMLFIWTNGAGLYKFLVSIVFSIVTLKREIYYAVDKVLPLGDIQIERSLEHVNESSLSLMLQLAPPEAGELSVKELRESALNATKTKQYNPVTGEWYVEGTYDQVNEALDFLSFIPNREFYGKAVLFLYARDRVTNENKYTKITLICTSNRLPYLQYALIDFLNPDEANNKTLTYQNILALDPDTGFEDISFYAFCFNGYFTFQNNATSYFTQRQINATQIKFTVVDRNQKVTCELALSDFKAPGERTSAYTVGVVTNPLPYLTQGHINFGNSDNVRLTNASITIEDLGNTNLNDVMYYFACRGCQIKDDSGQVVGKFKHGDFINHNQTLTLYRLDPDQLPEAEIQLSDDGGRTRTTPVPISFSGENISPPQLLRSYVDFGDNNEMILSPKHFSIETFNKRSSVIIYNITTKNCHFFKLSEPNRTYENALPNFNFDNVQTNNDSEKIVFVLEKDAKDSPECSFRLTFEGNNKPSQLYQMTIAYTDRSLAVAYWFNVATIIFGVFSGLSVVISLAQFIYEICNRKKDVANARLANYAMFLSATEKDNPREKEKFEALSREFHATSVDNSWAKGSNRLFSRQPQPIVEGLVYQKLPANKNCLYHAVAFYLRIDPQAMRAHIAKYIEDNEKNFKNVIKGKTSLEIEEYVENIRADDHWGGKIERQVLEEVYKRPILILNNAGHLSTPEKYKFYNNINNAIYVNYDGQQYNGFSRKPDTTAKSIFDRLPEKRRVIALNQEGVIQSGNEDVVFETGSLNSENDDEPSLAVDISSDNNANLLAPIPIGLRNYNDGESSLKGMESDDESPLDYYIAPDNRNNNSVALKAV